MTYTRAQELLYSSAMEYPQQASALEMILNSRASSLPMDRDTSTFRLHGAKKRTCANLAQKEALLSHDIEAWRCFAEQLLFSGC